MLRDFDPYAVLKLKPGSSSADVKRQYRRLAKIYHPDRNPGEEEWCGEQMKELGEAFAGAGFHRVLEDARPVRIEEAKLRPDDGIVNVVLDRTVLASADGVAKGAYVLAEAGSGTPSCILIATGSEVQIALEARERLEAEGTPTRVVSMPCREWFEAQEASYRQEVLPPSVRARVSIEAATPFGWRDFVGDDGECLGLDHFGASAPYQILYEQFGLTSDRVVAAAHASLSKVGATRGSTTGN